MSDKTGIEWTEATWNPTKGCDRVSAGCDHCYAMTQAPRLKAMGSPGYQLDGDPRTSGPGFLAHEWPDALDQPLRWTKPRKIFVNSMSDLFHDNISDEYIAKVFAVMATAYGHTFQVLTKRHARMRSLLTSSAFVELFDRAYCEIPNWADSWPDPEFSPGHDHLMTGPLRNVHLGVSVETQQWADIRIPALLDTPAAVRFLSCEPLLGPVDLRPYLDLWCDNHLAPIADCDCLGPGEADVDWVIVGGESGAGARPMHPDWARSLRDQCVAAGVPYLFKQHGEWAPGSSNDRLTAVVARDNGEWLAPSSRLWDEKSATDAENRRGWAFVHRAGKKAAGRELDGRTWDEYPVSS